MENQHSVDTTQIGGTRDERKPPSTEKILDAIRLADSDFQSHPTTLVQVRSSLIRNHPVGIESVASAVECEHRIILRDFPRQRLQILRRDIGRIGDDEIECLLNPRQPVTGNRTIPPRQSKRFGIGICRGGGGCGKVDAETSCFVRPRNERQPDPARSDPKIGNIATSPSRHAILNERQHGINQRFGIGTRLEGRVGKCQRKTVELTPPENPVHRLAGKSLVGGMFQALFQLFCQHKVRSCYELMRLQTGKV